MVHAIKVGRERNSENERNKEINEQQKGRFILK